MGRRSLITPYFPFFVFFQRCPETTRVQTCLRSRTAGRRPPTSRWCGGRGSPTSATPVTTWWDRTPSPVSWTSPGARSPPSVKRVSPPLSPSCQSDLHRLSACRLSPPSQSCTVQTPATWSTPPGPYPTPSSWWGPPFSTAAIPASSCRAAPPSPATGGSQGPPCGRLDCPTVSVSARMFFHGLSMRNFFSTQI